MNLFNRKCSRTKFKLHRQFDAFLQDICIVLNDYFRMKKFPIMENVTLSFSNISNEGGRKGHPHTHPFFPDFVASRFPQKSLRKELGFSLI